MNRVVGPDSDLAAEVSSLSRSLDQARAELAALRAEQEVREELLAPLEMAQRQLHTVTETLDRHLSQLERERSQAEHTAAVALVEHDRFARWRSRLPQRIRGHAGAPAVTRRGPGGGLEGPPTPEESADLDRLRSSPLFDGAWYLQRYPRVIRTGLSPALHYLRRGAAQRKDPGPHFDAAAYHQANPDLPDTVNALLHYLDHVPGVAT
ncbi:hypothetical protein ABFT23_15620 [Nocardioides sp. C4-1]|uniref:hypothetical protein n=1 Tax=Nocardioides sp. C4-1 TaxID=3151851 RepID=UPI003262F02D